MNDRAAKYVLGSDVSESARLEHQHQVWRPLSERTFDRVGVQAGWNVLDAGCGPGLVLADLNDRLAGEGELWGVDLSPEMIDAARQRLRRPNGVKLELHVGDLLSTELPDDHFDLIWLRWVLSFPEDPGAILHHLGRKLRAGGCIVVQDYYHEGVGLHPPSKGFDAVVRATRELYRAAGGDPWIAARLPELVESAGLELDHFDEFATSGSPGESVFEWGTRFFPPWSARFVSEGLMTEQERKDLLRDWQERSQNRHARFFAPTVVTVIARRPG